MTDQTTNATTAEERPYCCRDIDPDGTSQCGQCQEDAADQDDTNTAAPKYDYDNLPDFDLDDFDSEDLGTHEVADDSYLRGMWSDHTFGTSYGQKESRAKDLVTAHSMVTSFVNAFARDGRYLVRFSADIDTAGTEMGAKVVTITSAPVLDSTIDATQAGLILTGLAAHETCHPRYGRRTFQAVGRVFVANTLAKNLSNLLDDIRIERRFVDDYPGYSGVFQPTLDYVGKAGTKNGLHTQRIDRQLNLAIAATRYPAYSIWTAETADEATWWNRWANRWSKEDAPKRHVDGIREALAHIVAVKATMDDKARDERQAERQAPAPESDATTDGQEAASNTEDDANAPAESTPDVGSQSGTEPAPDPTDDSDEVGDPEATNDGNESAVEGMDDHELNAESQCDSAEQRADDYECGSESVNEAARDNGVSDIERRDLDAEADEIIESEANISDDGHGNRVDVAQTMRSLLGHGGGGAAKPSRKAIRYIRNAILRSRTGNTDRSPHSKRGRLDGKGLHRIGFGDTRVFEKKAAPSVGKYRVYVMVDASSSMDFGPLAEASQVAHAIADATTTTPSVKLQVLAWSSNFRQSSARAGVVRVWRSGQDPKDILKMKGLKTGWTPDANCLGWATEDILKGLGPDETPVIIFISDGCGQDTMTDRVNDARARGITVVGVSFGSLFNAKQLTERYGRDNFIEFEGSIEATAKPLADLFVKITQTRRS